MNVLSPIHAQKVGQLSNQNMAGYPNMMPAWSRSRSSMQSTKPMTAQAPTTARMRCASQPGCLTVFVFTRGV